MPDVQESAPIRKRAHRGTAIVASVLALATLVATTGCGEEAGDARLAVRPTVGLPDTVALGQPLDVRYAWRPTDEFTGPADDYKAFVHFRNPDGEIVFQDDHWPSTPTSQWEAGGEVTYRRWVYPPELFEFEYLDVFVGLYEPEEGKVLLRTGDGWSDTPQLHRVHVRTEDLSGLPVFGDGWYPEEIVGTDEYERWHWTQQQAEVMFVNPRDAALLHLRAHSPVEEIGGPQRIEVRVGSEFTYSVVNSEPEPFVDRIEVPGSAFGEEDWVPMTIDVDPAFRPTELDPESTDTRTLGLQVFTLYLGPPADTDGGS